MISRYLVVLRLQKTSGANFNMQHQHVSLPTPVECMLLGMQVPSTSMPEVEMPDVQLPFMPVAAVPEIPEISMPSVELPTMPVPAAPTPAPMPVAPTPAPMPVAKPLPVATAPTVTPKTHLQPTTAQQQKDLEAIEKQRVLYCCLYRVRIALHMPMPSETDTNGYKGFLQLLRVTTCKSESRKSVKSCQLLRSSSHSSQGFRLRESFPNLLKMLLRKLALATSRVVLVDRKARLVMPSGRVHL